MDTILFAKILVAALVVAQWIVIVRSQKHLSPVLLLALPLALFVLAFVAVICSMLSGGRVDAEKMLNDAIKQIIADTGIVLLAIIATIGAGIWIFLF